jgi:pyruvate formate lyase activating enzyme
MSISRRRLFYGCAGACAAAAAAGAYRMLRATGPLSHALAADAAQSSLDPAGAVIAHEAAHWEALDRKRVRCKLCPRECAVADMERGYCGVRENREGKYYTLVYGRPAAVHVDPIEKKPLFHYLPGATAYSIGTAGCNMECLFCQNWNLSQFRPEQVESFDLPPDALVSNAKSSGAAAIACTYNEPTVFYEYVRDAAEKSRAAGMPTVMISNGYIQRAPMVELTKSLGAVKIDLKSYSEGFYTETCSGRLQPVLDTLKTLKEQGIWFEIVVLLVTGRNDSVDEVKSLANWVATTLGTDVPLHFSRYFPMYKLKLPPTPVDTMQKAFDAAKKEGLNFVYVGNIELPGKADTICPGCGAIAIRRLGLMVVSNDLKDGKCPKCARAIPGVWKTEDAFRRTAKA